MAMDCAIPSTVLGVRNGIVSRRMNGTTHQAKRSGPTALRTAKAAKRPSVAVTSPTGTAILREVRRPSMNGWFWLSSVNQRTVTPVMGNAITSSSLNAKIASITIGR